MFIPFLRKAPEAEPVSFGKRNLGNVIQPTYYNGLPIVARFSDGSIEVAGLHYNFIISSTGASVRVN